MATYYGKYRATVTDNADAEQAGRLQISCESAGVTSAWAQACVPVLDPSLGLLILPDIGDEVWVEFEAGQAELPIWTGTRWRPPTAGQAVTLQNGTGASITITPTGSIELVATGSITISAASIDVSAAGVDVKSPTAAFSGAVQCATLIASGGVISPMYSPGAGNIW